MSSGEVFHYNERVFENNYRQFASLGEVFFPLKTNDNPAIISTIKRLGGGFGVGRGLNGKSGPDSFDYLTAHGVTPDKMSSMDTVLPMTDRRYFYDNGIRHFTIDSYDHLNDLMTYADIAKTSVALRLNMMEVFPERLNQFGAETSEIRAMAETLKKNGCGDVGVSFYVQTEVYSSWRDRMGKVLGHLSTNFADSGFSFINIGGGIPFDEIDHGALDETKSKLGADRIVSEPGREIAMNAVDLQTGILDVRGDSIMISSSLYRGFLDAAPNFHNKRFAMSLLTNEGQTVDFSSKSGEETAPVSVFGDNYHLREDDYFGQYYLDKNQVGNLHTGARMVIKNVGAYVEVLRMQAGGELDTTYLPVV